MERALISGTTAASTMESGSKIRSMDAESTNGLMADATMEIGKTTTCMAEVFIPGKTVDVMRESISTIENTVMVSMCGKMAGNTKDAGRTANSMVKVFTNKLTDKNAEEFGKMESASSGSMNNEELSFCCTCFYNV